MRTVFAARIPGTGNTMGRLEQAVTGMEQGSRLLSTRVRYPPLNAEAMQAYHDSPFRDHCDLACHPPIPGRELPLGPIGRLRAPAHVASVHHVRKGVLPMVLDIRFSRNREGVTPLHTYADLHAQSCRVFTKNLQLFF